MVKRADKNDFILTYPEVQKRLGGVSRRSVQKLVAEGKLTRQMIQGPNGLQAFFSEQEVAKLEGVKQGGEQPETKLARYETGISFFQQMVAERETTIQKQQEEIKTLVHETGKLEGQLSATQGQLKDLEQLQDELGKYKTRVQAHPILTVAWVVLALFAGWVLNQFVQVFAPLIGR